MDSIPDLPVVAADLDLLRQSLESVDYVVESLAVVGDRPFHRTAIIGEIRDFIRFASDDDVLLIYLSGHGVNFEGINYLIPPEGRLDDAAVLAGYLVPIDFADAIEASSAGTILVFVDACREGLQVVGTGPVKGARIGPWGQGQIRYAKHRQSAYVFGCAPGQFCYFVPGSNGFSIFGRALAQVMATASPAKTFGEVRRAVQLRVDELYAEYSAHFVGAGVGKQSVRVLGEFDSNNQIDRCVISSSTKELRSGFGSAGGSSWRAIATTSRLWEMCSPTSMTLASEARSSVADVASTAQESWAKWDAESPEMAWRDEFFVSRLIERLEFLCRESVEDLSLSLVEVASLLTAAFLSQAVRAEAIQGLISQGGLCVASTGQTVGLRGSFERFTQSTSRLTARARAEERSDRPEALQRAEEVAAWLMLKWSRHDVALWDSSEAGLLDPERRERLCQSITNSGIADCLPVERIFRLSRTVGGRIPGARSLAGRSTLEVEHVVRPGTADEQVVRAAMLDVLLASASRLAIDVASLDDIVASHVWADDRLQPAGLLDDLAEATWVPVGSARVLDATCDHPAIDYALKAHVAESDTILAGYADAAHHTHDRFERLRLPNRLKADRVRAALSGARPAFELPHLRFQLDDDKVRGLLMGEQLYDHRTLALRELYQNALDACRYHDARRRFLAAQGSELAPWQGRIEFRQGIDGRGRPYIECEDSGVGMSSAEITQCFARAGTRFSDLPEFAEEQSEWRRTGSAVRLFPNSQFGIGVFSYFMLAHEIELTTCRISPEGVLGDQLRVRIDGEGTLFRITSDGVGKAAGTTVRLILRNETAQVSSRVVLRSLLWVADYLTTISEDGAEVERWSPGELRPTMVPGYRTAAASGAVTRSSSEDVWWSSDTHGRLVADGIEVGQDHDFAIINLKSEHRPELTVDRRKLRSYDKKYVYSLMSRTVADLAPAPSWLEYTWLWSFGSKHPELGDALASSLAAAGERIPYRSSGDYGSVAGTGRRVGSRLAGRWDEVELSVDTLGCLPADQSVIQEMEGQRLRSRAMPHQLLACRAATLRLAANSAGDLSAEDLVEVGHQPLLTATRWERVLRILLSRDLNGKDPWITGRIPRRHLARAVLALRLSPRAILSELRAFGDTLELDLGEFDGYEPRDKAPDDIDLRILSELLRIKGGADTESPVDPVAYLLRPAAEHELSLSEIVRRAAAFTDLLEISLDTPSNSNAGPVSAVNANAISSNRNGGPPFLSGPLTTGDVLALSERIQLHPEAAMKAFSVHASLTGAWLPDQLTDAGLSAIPDHADLVLLSRRLTGKPPWLESEVAVGHILRGARQLDVDPSVVLDRIGKYAQPLSLSLPDQALLDRATDFDSREVGILLSRRLDGEPPWISGNVPVGHIIGAAQRTGLSPGEVREVLSRYSGLIGLSVPGEFSEDYELGDIDDQLLSENGDGRHPWVSGAVGIAHILRVAVALDTPPVIVEHRLLELAACSLVNFLPGSDSDALDIEEDWKFILGSPASARRDYARRRPELRSARLLGLSRTRTRSGRRGMKIHGSLSGRDVLETAVRWGISPSVAMEEIARYVEVVGLENRVHSAVWDLDEPLSEAEMRLLGLSQAVTRMSPLKGAVAPGAIISAAVRVGVPVRDVLSVLDRFRTLLEFDYIGNQLADVSSRMPDDVDLCLVSLQLTGEAPWLSGGISKRHLRNVSWVTGLPPSELRCRAEDFSALGIFVG